MNLPHALATLTRDVLQNYMPEWWADSTLGRYRVEGEPLIGLDYPDWRAAKSVFRGYGREFDPPVVLVSPDEYRRIEAHCLREYQKRVSAYVQKLNDMMELYVTYPGAHGGTLTYPGDGTWRWDGPNGERMRGPRGPDPFSVTLTREELAKLYPDPARCVGEDGSVVYAPLHFEHPSRIVKGKLKE